MGNVTNVHLDLGLVLAIFSVAGNFNVSAGTEVGITFWDDLLYLFDQRRAKPSSRRRLTRPKKPSCSTKPAKRPLVLQASFLVGHRAPDGVCSVGSDHCRLPPPLTRRIDPTPSSSSPVTGPPTSSRRFSASAVAVTFRVYRSSTNERRRRLRVSGTVASKMFGYSTTRIGHSGTDSGVRWYIRLLVREGRRRLSPILGPVLPFLMVGHPTTFI